VRSVKVTLLSNTEGTSLYYTTDGSEPISNSVGESTTKLAQNGDAFTLQELGETTIKVIGKKEGYLDSFLVTKTYLLIDMAPIPRINPNGGTFPGSVKITLGDPSDGTIVHYTVDKSLPSPTSQKFVLSGSSFLLQGDGWITVKAMAVKDGFAPSSLIEETFQLIPKVKAPSIMPETNVFSVSASLSFYCDTPKAKIYYTKDGSDPSTSSLSIEDGEIVTIDHSGKHTVKAMATRKDMLPSDVTTKIFQILDRCPSPHFSPPPGKLIGDVTILLSCAQYVDDDTVPDWSWSGGRVYYTTDGVSTPTLNSANINCGESIHIFAPGKYIIRAFVVAAQRSPSEIVQVYIYKYIVYMCSFCSSSSNFFLNINVPNAQIALGTFF